MASANANYYGPGARDMEKSPIKSVISNKLEIDFYSG